MKGSQRWIVLICFYVSFFFFFFCYFFCFVLFSVFKIFEKFLSRTHQVFKWIIILQIYILNHAWLFSILNLMTYFFSRRLHFRIRNETDFAKLKVKSKIQGPGTEGNKIFICFRQLSGLFRKAKHFV